MNGPITNQRGYHRRQEDRGKGGFRETKTIYRSRALQCAFLSILASLASLLCYPLVCEEQATFATSVTAMVSLLGSCGAFWFRLIATKEIE